MPDSASLFIVDFYPEKQIIVAAGEGGKAPLSAFRNLSRT